MSSYLQELPQIPDPTIRSPGDTQVYDGQTTINSVQLNQKGTLPDETGNSTNDKTRWTETDDVLLCSAWLNASVNPIVGTDQNAKVFWKDICGYFNRHRQVHQAEQNKQGISTRWKRLNTAVGKFVGCYEEAVRLRQSGMNEADQIGLAKDLFLKKVGKKFGFMQAWEALKNQEKWCSQIKNTSTSIGDAGTSATIIDDDDNGEEVRPIGRKAAKAQEKRKSLLSESNDNLLDSMEMEREKVDIMRKLTTNVEKQTEFQATQTEMQVRQTEIQEKEFKDRQKRRRGRRVDKLLDKDVSKMTEPQKAFYYAELEKAKEEE